MVPKPGQEFFIFRRNRVEWDEYVFVLRKKFLLGLAEIQYLVEDRFPEAEHDKKFKHHLSVWLGWMRYSWLWRTATFSETDSFFRSLQLPLCREKMWMSGAKKWM